MLCITVKRKKEKVSVSTSKGSPVGREWDGEYVKINGEPAEEEKNPGSVPLPFSPALLPWVLP